MKKKEIEAVEMSANLQRKLAGLSFRLSKDYKVERKEAESRLLWGMLHADRTYDPSLGLTLEAYRELCMHNAFEHFCRTLTRRKEEANRTDHLEEPICAEWTLGDCLAERRNGAERMRRALAIREWLGGLTGTSWCVALASLCGFRFSEIARKLGIPRTTFDRTFGPAFAAFAKEAPHA